MWALTLTLVITRSFISKALFEVGDTSNKRDSLIAAHSFAIPVPLRRRFIQFSLQLFGLPARDFTTSTHPIPYFLVHNIS